jgi:hypothetical protein
MRGIWIYIPMSVKICKFDTLHTNVFYGFRMESLLSRRSECRGTILEGIKVDFLNQ